MRITKRVTIAARSAELKKFDRRHALQRHIVCAVCAKRSYHSTTLEARDEKVNYHCIRGDRDVSISASASGSPALSSWLLGPRIRRKRLQRFDRAWFWARFRWVWSRVRFQPGCRIRQSSVLPSGARELVLSGRIQQRISPRIPSRRLWLVDGLHGAA